MSHLNRSAGLAGPVRWRLIARWCARCGPALSDYERWVVTGLLRAEAPSPFMLRKLYAPASRLLEAEAQQAARVWLARRTGEHMVPADDGWSASFFTTDSAPAWLRLL
jgi:hypothetical protein